MSSYLLILSVQAALFSFQMQPMCSVFWDFILNSRNYKCQTKCTVWKYYTATLKKAYILKCPYYGLWKITIFWFWVSPTTGWHACKVKKHFHFLIMCIYFTLFAQRLSTINLTKSLLCVMLICGDWSHWLISFPFHHTAAFVSAVLLCVQPLPLFLPLQNST